MQNGKERYQEFLKSAFWRELRQKCFATHGEDCKGCGSFFMVQPHHLFYPKVLEESTVSHLIPLCWKCHKGVHESRMGAFVYREEFVPAKRMEIIIHLQNLHAPETYREHEADKARVIAQKARRQSFDQQKARERRGYKTEAKRSLPRLFLEQAAMKKLHLSEYAVKDLPDLEIQRLLRELNQRRRDNYSIRSS